VSARHERERRRAGLVAPVIVVIIAFACLVGLGTWQLERKAWKEALIDTLARRLAAPPAELPPRETWASLDPAQQEFRRVTLSAEFVPGEEALVYAGGSALRPDVSGPGYWVFAPARRDDGGIVVLDRGFVPEGRQDPKTRAAGDASGRHAFVGVLRWPEQPGRFAPPGDPGHNLWFTRDHRAIADAKGWSRFGEVAPFFIAVEGPQPPGGLPRAGPLRANLRNEHLQYALTWYGLAAVLAIAFAFWLRSRRREQRAAALNSSATPSR
jgi:surfeit locus 1 family protein